ncbi:DUF4190 domain-containing protein [Demequina capsici]|uniref:DUF4190 domain-containing protein n=1 Tax=Demequina capsici TaxID=3075620 RepID=A0AA96F6A9_9MICO|nr:DUF4190 domain-containing protein [Demequina sp. OYTSA14]WNM24633.1 DUF4190 domain-containing protein [Demequina sp. OYTSA14]
MADDQRPSPDDPWVAPPLGSDGTAGASYTDPFAQPTAASIPPPMPAPADPYAQPGQPYPSAPAYGAPYGGAPYPGQPYGPRSDKNWMGIVSLVTSLLGISLIAVILGHLGLRAVKRGEADNKGIALAGTIIGWLGIAGSILVIIALIAFSATFSSAFDDSGSWSSTAGPSTSFSADPAPLPSQDPAQDLAQPGDGVFGVDEANNYFLIYVDGAPAAGTCLSPSSVEGYDLDVVDCGASHVGEVFLSEPLTDVTVDGDFTSDATWSEMYTACSEAFDSATSGTDAAYELGWWVFAASDDNELSADDTFLCVASVDFTASTGSALAASGGQAL